MKFVNIILLFFFSIQLFGQHVHQAENKCGYDEWLEEYEALNPGYTEMIQQGLRDFAKKKISEKRSSSLVLIPVHVIIVHAPGESEGSGSNFTLAHVQSQIDVLNQDFGFYNSDAGGVPAQFPAGDTGIQFCLASVDPDGAPTDGITRYPTNTSMANSSGRTEVIQATKWPREDYMNIWSAPNLPFLGLATVPGTGGLPNSNQDFVLVASTTFGGPGYGTNTPYDLGRTTTHEVGHWLGLSHIWGNGCSVDDGISDTPEQEDSNFGCPDHPSPTCGNSGDMFMNYMDYVNDACMFSFSLEQGQYMNTILNTSRASLQGSAATACAFVVPLTLTVTDQQDPNCSDSNDGYILVEAEGGTPNYSYSLNGGTITNNGLFTDLSGGSYSIEVFDADGLTTSVTVFLDTPLPLIGDAQVTATNPCSNQSIAEVTINVTGGTNPYFFSLNMGSNQQNPVFDELPNGFYSYLITDNNGCTTDGIIEVVGAEDIDITVDLTQDVSCNGFVDGEINISATGGSGSLSYAIDGESNQSDGIFQLLDMGEYLIFATDEAGCYDSVTVSINEPEEIEIMTDVTDILCNGDSNGSLSISSTGGNGSSYTYNVNGEDQQSGEITSLPAGEYTVISTDESGCFSESSTIIAQPDILLANIVASENVTCEGGDNGSVEVIATGGTPPYQYSLGTGLADNGIFTGLAAGSYSILINDANNCMTEIAFDIQTNSSIQLELFIEDIACFGFDNGSITAETSNVMGTVTYSINNQAPQTENIFENLVPGDYTIIASDDSGCDVSLTATITQPAELTLDIEVISDVLCKGGNDGEAVFNTTGGIAPYFYEMDGNNNDPEGLAAGEYNVSVTDNNGCVEVSQFTILEPESSLDIEYTFDGDDLIVNGIGGTEPYLYSFDGGDFTQINKISSTKDVIVVSVQDANGCITSISVVVNNTSELTEEWEINAYPIPMRDELNLNFNFNKSLVASIQIFDLNGRLVNNISSKKYQSGENSVKIDVSNFANSIYIVKIASAEGYRYIKVTKT